MIYHDFHLDSYEVKDRCSTIVLHLAYDYPGQQRLESRIEFQEVAAYDFINTGGAIILDIDEVPPAEILRETFKEMKARCDQHGGYEHWDDDPGVYLRNLVRAGCRAWRIAGAVGFEGYVIAERIVAEPP